jgi:hypothetical protein
MHVRKRSRRRRSVERTMRSGRRSIASALPGGVVEGFRVGCSNGEGTEE